MRLFVPETGMGWHQLGDALGGLMLGGLLGLVAGGGPVFLLDVRRRRMAAMVALATALDGLAARLCRK